MERKRISVQSAKAKGRELQKWVCKKIAEVTGGTWGKDCEIESRPMGQSGTDVRMESQMLEKFPYSVECKWQEAWSIPAWIEQAKANQMKNTNWILFAKRSRIKPIVVMDAEHFFEIYERALKETLRPPIT